MKTSTSQPSASKTTSFRTLLPYLAATLIFIQLIANIFLLKFYLDQKDTITLTKSDKTTIEIQRMELAGEYDKAIRELESEKGSNAALNAKIESQQVELARQKEESDRRLMEGTSSLGQEITRLRQNERKYKDEIVNLTGKVKNLEQDIKIKTDQYSALESTNVEIQTQLEKTAAIAAAEKAAAEKAAEEAKRAIAARDAQIEKASFVLVPSVTVKAQKVKGDESNADSKTREVEKAKNVDRLDICFSTAPNPLIPRSMQKFYLRLLDSTGEPVAIGQSNIKTANGEVRFALEVELDYDGTAMSKCVFWIPNVRLTRGKYTVDVFNNGRQVGQSLPLFLK